MKEKKGLVVLGIGALFGGLLLIFRKRKPALPEPPPNGVVVGLWNPPKEATMWSLSLADWDLSVPPIRFIGWPDKARLDIAEVAAFEIPSGVEFPLRVISLQLTKWNEDRTALIVFYEVQSYRPIHPFTGEPDPDYREVSIPGYGSYFYNVAKERFEKA